MDSDLAGLPNPVSPSFNANGEAHGIEPARWLRISSAARGALPFALLVCAAFAISAHFTAPGWMTVDSGYQLDQARAFQFQDDMPVLMALLWHYTDRIMPGPLGLFLLMTAGYWAGLGLVFWALPGRLVPRLLGCLLVGFFPPAFSNVPMISKDALMQSGLLAGLGCFMIESRRLAKLRLALGVVFITLAVGARHNAPAAAFPLLAIPCLSSRLLMRFSRWRRLLLASGAALGLTLALTFGLKRALAPITQATDFWQVIPAFDLAGMSLEENENLFDPGTGVLTPGMGLDEIRQLYNPIYVNSLYYCIPFRGKPCVHLLRRVQDPHKLKRVRQNWLRAIWQHPAAYLKHRSIPVARMLMILDGTVLIYFVERGPFDQYGRDYPVPHRARALMSWIEGKVTQVWFRPWPYFACGVLFLPFGLISYLRGASVVPFACALSGFTYMLSLFVGIGSADYRYTVWTTLCTLLALSATLISALAARRGNTAARMAVARAA